MFNKFITFILLIIIILLIQKNLEIDKTTIIVNKNNKNIENKLNKYKNIIGDDYNGYKGHILRVLCFTNKILENNNDHNLFIKYKKIIEYGLVYHDIALWTDNKLSYVIPSYDVAYNDLKNELNKDELDLIKNIIILHHKITPYKSNNNNIEHEKIINAVIKADLIDFSLGIIPNGLARADINKVLNEIPNNKFHSTLINFGYRINGLNYIKSIKELSQIFYL